LAQNDRDKKLKIKIKIKEKKKQKNLRHSFALELIWRGVKQ